MRQFQWFAGKRRIGAFLGCCGVVALALSTAPIRGQDFWAAPAVTRACGPRGAKLDVSNSADHSIQQPDKGNGIIYLIQDVPAGPASELYVTRIGVDGRWVGGNRGRSHFYLSLKPGAYHFCAAGQWNRLIGPESVAVKRLTVEAGRIYFLRVGFDYIAAKTPVLRLEPVDEDQGVLGVETSDRSASKPK